MLGELHWNVDNADNTPAANKTGDTKQRDEATKTEDNKEDTKKIAVGFWCSVFLNKRRLGPGDVTSSIEIP